MNTEQPAQWRYRVVRPQTVDYRELFRESDIKSAVAFFRISFSISRRCICFLIFLSSVCSGVRGSPGGVFPWRSIRNDLTQREAEVHRFSRFTVSVVLIKDQFCRFGFKFSSKYFAHWFTCKMLR
ncbi:hypothetical protein MKleb_5710 (plasmid) [Klebsiella sp. PL-2018]|nr:hypothetical protein MKleb_5571 [Klebsiella sp. PL-2018]QXD01186.1 hypothetical protein MKleb_5685 [Klebsiella sp. PL-2018]QXD01195.1 hypothetical protein MKleb_5694 [Klebsiella sp. PL-2018]QXD01211.1 hypothetical protein MKleb_5710 [Klebsiella sp. PL-2018]